MHLENSRCILYYVYVQFTKQKASCKLSIVQRVRLLKLCIKNVIQNKETLT